MTNDKTANDKIKSDADKVAGNGHLAKYDLADFDAVMESSSTTKFASNFPADPKKGLRLTSLAISGDAQKADDFIGREFHFIYWFLHKVEVLNKETGEMNPAPRIVLISADGEAIQFVSNGVAQSLRLILHYEGVGELLEPVPVIVKQKATRQGFKILYLQPNPKD